MKKVNGCWQPLLPLESFDITVGPQRDVALTFVRDGKGHGDFAGVFYTVCVYLVCVLG